MLSANTICTSHKRNNANVKFNCLVYLLLLREQIRYVIVFLSFHFSLNINVCPINYAQKTVPRFHSVNFLFINTIRGIFAL